MGGGRTGARPPAEPSPHSSGHSPPWGPADPLRPQVPPLQWARTPAGGPGYWDGTSFWTDLGCASPSHRRAFFPDNTQHAVCTKCLLRQRGCRCRSGGASRSHGTRGQLGGSGGQYVCSSRPSPGGREPDVERGRSPTLQEALNSSDTRSDAGHPPLPQSPPETSLPWL